MFESGDYCYANVKRWANKIIGKCVFKLGRMIIPVNIQNMHWCCMFVDFETKLIQYFDSMGSRGQVFTRGIKQYLIDESKKYINKNDHDIPSDLLNIEESWTVKGCVVKDEHGKVITPQQTNGVDCGVFTCVFANLLSVGAPLNFSADEMPHFRQRITADLLNKTL